jgi:hypothetical protein
VLLNVNRGSSLGDIRRYRPDQFGSVETKLPPLTRERVVDERLAAR